MSVPGLDEREIHLYAAIISARERGHRYGDCIQTEYESIIGHLLYKRNDPFFKDQKEVVDTVVALHNKGLIEFNDVLIVRGLDGENKSYETYIMLPKEIGLKIQRRLKVCDLCRYFSY